MITLFPLPPLAFSTEQSIGKDEYCQIADKLYEAYENKNYDYIKTFKAKYANDAFIFPTCQLLLFLDNEISSKNFIDSFPESENELYLFSTRTWGCETHPPKIFSINSGEDHPEFIYYEELLDLMAKDDRGAIKKVVNTLHLADGALAEELLWNKLPKFISKHPDVVLKNWDLFRNHIDSVDSDEYTEVTYRKLIELKKIVQNAKADNASKSGFLSYLDKELKKHKQK
jgi:hypothetical protein